MKPKQNLELIDKLIFGRLRVHLLKTSKSIVETPDKWAFVVDFEQEIAQIDFSLPQY